MPIPSKIIDIIGVPSDLGANIEGALMGPATLRTAGLHKKLQATGWQTNDTGDIYIPNRFNLHKDKLANKHLKAIQQIATDLKAQVLSSFHYGNTPLILGGDHSISIGSLSALAEFHQNKKIGLIWVDTHADINTPTSSPSGNIHGMPISILLKNGFKELTDLFPTKSIDAKNIVLIGLRDVDAIEKTLLKTSGVHFYTMRDIDERGIQQILAEINTTIFNSLEGIHVSFDLDVMDPLQVPGVSTPVPGGLTLREAHLLLELLHENNTILSADFVELNPFNDIQGQSAKMATELICSLFGKAII